MLIDEQQSAGRVERIGSRVHIAFFFSDGGSSIEVLSTLA
jgi:hypothetical protein